MSGLMLRLITVIGLLLTISVHARAQIEINMFDFDGTLVENRQSRDGTFNSTVLLYRNEQRLNLLQPLAVGPKILAITQQDLHRISEYLGSGEGRPGSVSREVELQDGQRIRPGEYYLRYPDSYEYFREGTEGRNHLLSSFITAESRGENQ